MDDVISLENTDMVREFANKFANMLVNASDLAKQVAGLEAKVREITDALTVANEAAARAIEERNAALRERDKALEAKEIAEQAWQQVNHQRIEAERTLGDVRDSLRVSDEMLKEAQLTEADAKAEADLWKEEAARNASARDTIGAEKEVIISALRLELQAAKDVNGNLQMNFNASEADNRNLRKIIAEAKLAVEGTRGVLEGILAAE